MRLFNGKSGKHFQQGAVLVTALVLMAILAIIGVASMRSNTADVNIHKNMKNRANAFQCAEAAIRTGEIILEGLTTLPEVVTSKPADPTKQVWHYATPEIQDIFTKDAKWWAEKGEAGTDMTNAAHEIGCVDVPRFIIEKIGIVDDGSGAVEISERSKSGIDYFRVTGFSVGMESNATVLLQTTFAKRLR